MKKYMICALLYLCFTNSAMNNNDTRPVRFESAEVLYNRLQSYDQRNNTTYSDFSERHKVHYKLGQSIQLRSQAGTLITSLLKEDNPHLAEEKILEHRRKIMTALGPELAEKAAKL